jgi:nickel transport system ATP-binding protein
MSLLSARHVSKAYRTFSLVGATKTKPVLDDISIEIAVGETVALLGRSGCGKSTLARLLVGLEKPDRGDVLFEGRSLNGLDKAGWSGLRRAVQMVFQDPVGAVNPRATVEAIVAEPLGHLCGLKGRDAAERVRDLLSAVGLGGAEADKFPHQLSGGQLQRVCIARALAPNPKLIILDEAVSNLDMPLQIQMLDLFARLRRTMNVSYLFVTHDLRLVEKFCSRVLVMGEGRIVEEAPVSGALAFSSFEGRALSAAVLPPMPRQLMAADPRI